MLSNTLLKGLKIQRCIRNHEVSPVLTISENTTVSMWFHDPVCAVRRNFNAHFKDGIDQAVEFSFTDDKTMYPGAEFTRSGRRQA